MTTTEQKAADLRAAAKYIETHDWIQGEIGHVGGAVCGAGAIRAAIVGTATTASFTDEALERYAEAWDAASKYVGQPLPSWNDAPERTKDEVVAALRGAAESVAS